MIKELSKIDNIVIGSRGSKLALIYANKVKFALEKEFLNKIEIMSKNSKSVV